MAKMGRKTIGDRAMTAAERVQKAQLIGNDITEKYKAALGRINWKRRRAAEKSALAWFTTYCVGVIADAAPDGHLPQALADMSQALSISRAYQIIMARGHGKTTLAEGVAAMAIATGKRKYCCLIGANLDGGKSLLDDIYKILISEKVAQDYPEFSLPLVMCADTSFKRRLTIDGVSCDCNHNSTELILPTVIGEDGKPVKTSGSVLKAFGFGAGIRGKKKGSLRPDLVVLDDIQTDETAENPESVQKALDIIRKSVLNLGGRKKIAVINTATVIQPDDLAVKLKADKAWKTTEYPAFISWPNDYTTNGGLWREYFSLFDGENINNEKHSGSMEYYKAHRAEMDAGANVLSPSNFSKGDGHLSAVQKLMDKLHEIGEYAFGCEMQMRPRESESLLTISPTDVHAATNADIESLTLPAGYTTVTMATDLNLSYGLTTVIKAYKPDTSRALLFNEVFPCRIDGKLTGKGYYDAVYSLLTDYGRRLSSMLAQAGLNVDYWGLDCNGTPFEAVNDFARAACRLEGIALTAIGMRGCASMRWNAQTKMRLREAVAGVVLVGDAVELARAGAGRKWLWWNADLYKENCHRSLLAIRGSAGAAQLYKPSNGLQERAIREYCIQMCNEKIISKQQRQDGRLEYFWKSKEPHDYLDADAMADALAGYSGISSASVSDRAAAPAQDRPAMPARSQMRIVRPCTMVL